MKRELALCYTTQSALLPMRRMRRCVWLMGIIVFGNFKHEKTLFFSLILAYLLTIYYQKPQICLHASVAFSKATSSHFWFLCWNSSLFIFDLDGFEDCSKNSIKNLKSTKLSGNQPISSIQKECFSRTFWIEVNKRLIFPYAMDSPLLGMKIMETSHCAVKWGKIFCWKMRQIWWKLPNKSIADTQNEIISIISMPMAK